MSSIHQSVDVDVPDVVVQDPELPRHQHVLGHQSCLEKKSNNDILQDVLSYSLSGLKSSSLLLLLSLSGDRNDILGLGDDRKGGMMEGIFFLLFDVTNFSPFLLLHSLIHFEG